MIKLQGDKEREKRIYYLFDPDDESTILGQGGMGVVFRGKQLYDHSDISEDVAIKVIFSNCSATTIQRAKQEASIQIKHDNVIEMKGMVEVDTNTKTIYHVVSEYLDGTKLSKVIANEGFVEEVRTLTALPVGAASLTDREKAAVKIIKSVLSGLDALHNYGYIHRDIDPSNIILCKDRKIKLIDLGIAKHLFANETEEEDADSNPIDPKLTAEGGFIGKPEYASPEQVEGRLKKMNRTSDLYSVGIVLFELLTGKVPYEGSIDEILDGHKKGKLPKPPGINKELYAVIRKATAKNQKDRYQSASEFIVALEKVERGEGAGPIEWKKWGASVAVAAVALLAGVGIWLHTSNRNEAYREKVAEAEQYLAEAAYPKAEAAYAQAEELIPTDSIAGKVHMLSVLNKGIEAYQANDYDQAASLFKQAADLQSSDACYYLGEMNMEGTGAPKDYQTGTAYIDRALRMGNQRAYYWLGRIYAEGLGKPVNPTKANAYFDKAKQFIDWSTERNENPEMLYLKGKLYVDGFGVTQDKTYAATYFETAAKQGYAPAMYALYALKGADDPAAQSWLEQAARKKYPEALYELAKKWLAEKSTAEKGLQLLLEATGKNYSPALRYMGSIYASPFPEYETIRSHLPSLRLNPALYLEYTEKAVEYDKENYQALYNLFSSYYAGIGVEKDTEKALQYASEVVKLIRTLPEKDQQALQCLDICTQILQENTLSIAFPEGKAGDRAGASSDKVIM